MCLNPAAMDLNLRMLATATGAEAFSRSRYRGDPRYLHPNSKRGHLGLVHRMPSPSTDRLKRQIAQHGNK